GKVQRRSPTRNCARVGPAHPLRKRALERFEPGAERQPARPQHLEHALLLPLSEDRPRERDLLVAAVAHEAGSAGAASPLLATCIPYSSESSSASQEASMMFSDTPIEPQTSSPSEASSSTRVTAPVPFVSSRMRTLKFTRSMSRRCGWISTSASRSARPSALTGPLPSAVRTYRSPSTQILLVAP